RTSRCAHADPNLGQVPAHTEYGARCRACYMPTREDWLQVGVDASGLEMRMLAHYMAPYDGGAFAEVVLKGRREDGTDIHSRWQKLTGLFYRDSQKTLTYAMLYGAGDKKLGYTVIADHYKAFEAGLTDIPVPALSTARDIGKQVRDRLLSGEEALGKLIADVKHAWKSGYIVGLDGRVIQCHSQHGALNDLLQSAGSIVMKWAHVLAYQGLTCHLGPHGSEYAFMLHVHDECQMETKPEVAELAGSIYAESIAEAGRRLGCNIELAGDVSV
ncbi:unnamed protein product, partial [marine sediment metagenome]